MEEENKRKKISKEEREKIKMKYHGKCGYCGYPLNQRFHIDHILPFRSGGECVNENLLAVCTSCNLQKGGRRLEDFREFIEDKIRQLNRVANFQVAKRFDLVQEKPKRIVFYYETIKKEKGLFDE